MNFNINLFTPASGDSDAPGSSIIAAQRLPPIAPTVATCPSCKGDVAPVDTKTGWQSCPYCEKRLQIRAWPVVRQNTNAAAALSDQVFMVGYFDVLSGSTYSLEKGRDGMVKAVDGTLLSDESISLGGKPGRRFRSSCCSSW